MSGRALVGLSSGYVSCGGACGRRSDHSKDKGAFAPLSLVIFLVGFLGQHY
jgi:hypothetical protein